MSFFIRQNENQNFLRLTGMLLLVFLFSLAFGCKKNATEPEIQPDNNSIQLWLSSPNQDIKFKFQNTKIDTGSVNGLTTIRVNPSVLYQEMDGFGFALTGGSALHINNMSQAARTALLKELFAYDADNIGTSYLRVSIGASDLDAEVFSYDDVPLGQTDVNMDNFSLNEDRKNVIPILKEILKINPDIKILGSPWSAPVWMKTNKNSVGGSLISKYYDAYALYFVKYIQGMAEEGIRIDAITVQNEPLHPGNNPSMYMPANEQTAFIKTSLGPAFRDAGITTKIIIYDHNADRPDYPLAVLSDPDANQYIDGSAFHLYGGDISQLSEVHDAFPDKNLYFTEQWVGAPGDFRENLRWHTKELIIGASRNWCKTVIEWNLAANENLEPHTDGGCTQCLGAITIEGDKVTRNPAYYIIAHAAKFVRPGSKRVYSTIPNDLPNIVFQTPGGKLVIIVLNNTDSEESFNIQIADKSINSKLAAGAVGTYVFPETF